jgi:hypothetical protein
MTTAISLLRAQYSQSFGWLEGTMDGVTDEVANFNPPGAPMPIAGLAAHIVTAVDFFVLHFAKGGAPLLLSSHADSSGVSEPPPQGAWEEWGNRVQVDLPVFHEYAKAVFGAVDEYLATLSDGDLGNEIDMGPFGTQTLEWVFNIMILNTYSHTGEIACIKGMQGLKGYPM